MVAEAGVPDGAGALHNLACFCRCGGLIPGLWELKDDKKPASMEAMFLYCGAAGYLVAWRPGDADVGLSGRKVNVQGEKCVVLCLCSQSKYSSALYIDRHQSCELNLI